MVYLSLYRRQRPLTFSGMTGQEHVARTLSHALSRGQLAHAYLFCGPRGTGKTTTAKILARAVNCSNYPAPEPCGECVSCRNIAAGVSMDVIEMDAASNRGIEEIRELRERTRYASSESRYKVYIIDEAHMLTNEACNAFLKTLEEPPPGVIFILATTDPSRLPSTIVSRCQRFNFHLLTLPQITQRLKEVVEEENWQAEEEALQLIARLAEGSMRDALGLLEQCRAYGQEIITAEHVRSVTGATRSDIIAAMAKALAESDLESAIDVLQQVTFSGRDLALFLRDLTYLFSRLLLYGEAGELRPEESYYGLAGLLQQFKGCFTRKALLEIIELLHQVSGELRHAHNPQFILEITLIRILRVIDRVAGQQPGSAGTLKQAGAKSASPEPLPQGSAQTVEPSGQDFTGRAVEKSMLSGRSGRKKEVPQEAPAHKISQVAAPGPEVKAAAAAPDQDLDRFWPQLLAEVKKKQSSTCDYLNMALSRALQGEQLVLTYRKGVFAAERIGDHTHRGLVEKLLLKYLARPIRLKVVTCDGDDPAISPPSEAAAAEDMPVAPPEDRSPQRQDPDGGDILFNEALKLFRGNIIDQSQ